MHFPHFGMLIKSIFRVEIKYVVGEQCGGGKKKVTFEAEYGHNCRHFL